MPKHLSNYEIEMLERGGQSAEDYWRNETRRIIREALERERRMNPPKPIPAWSPEISPGIRWEDIDVILAAKRGKRRKGYGFFYG